MPETSPDLKPKTSPQPPPSERRGSGGGSSPSAFWVLAVLCIVLRLVALSSDAYPRLSWSSALLTDEGFYLHNARNLVLFGSSRQDEWNNALIMPALHAVQVGVFRIFGVGVVQTRLISVAASLLMLGILFLTLEKPPPPLGRRGLGGGSLPVALCVVLFLGCDHSVLLYNRLGLLDTPAACLLVGAFACFVSGMRGQQKAFGWGLACGLVFVLAYTVRGFAALVFLCPFFALFPVWRQQKRLIWGILFGLIVGILCYILLWYLPNRAELSRYNSYYLDHQLLPHSLRRLGFNVWSSFFDWSRGMVPYLLKHSPLLFGLAMWRTVGFFLPLPLLTEGGGEGVVPRRDSPFERFLILWMLVLMILCSVVNYNPSRYYVLFYPPMMILAAMQLTGNREEKEKGRRGEGERAMPGIENTRYQKISVFQTRRAAILIAIWAVVNGCWLVDWLAHLQYKQIEADRYLARTLPPESWLTGSVAPGLCINNAHHPVNMIVGLCNDKQPIEKQLSKSRYIIMLDGNWRERHFVNTYPEIVTEQNKIHTFQGLLRPFFEIGVYKVPDNFGRR